MDWQGTRIQHYPADGVNPDISWGFVTSRRKRAWIQGARSEGDAGIFENMSRRLNKRNVADMPDCADAVEIP